MSGVIQRKKDVPPAEDIGEVAAGVIPHLLQWDERWGYQIYGDNMIAVNGCGPTVISMVAAGLTGDNTITPYRVAKFAEENGYYEGDAGTSWALMTEGAAQFGSLWGRIGVERRGEFFSALVNGNPHYMQHESRRFYHHRPFYCPCRNRGW